MFSYPAGYVTGKLFVIFDGADHVPYPLELVVKAPFFSSRNNSLHWYKVSSEVIKGSHFKGAPAR